MSRKSNRREFVMTGTAAGLAAAAGPGRFGQAPAVTLAAQPADRRLVRRTATSSRTAATRPASRRRSR